MCHRNSSGQENCVSKQSKTEEQIQTPWSVLENDSTALALPDSPFLGSFHICWIPATMTLMGRQEVRSCCGVLARDKDEPGWRKKDDFLVVEVPIV